MSGSSVPLYFELSWSILSSIGLLTCGIGISICLIIGFTPLSLVPIITSGACAIANGLCYYAFYAEYPVHNQVVAGVFADIAWLIQEAGLSFYSYQILRRLLRNKKERLVFFGLFWTIMTAITVTRVMILIKRAITLSEGATALTIVTNARQKVIDHLHVVYFVFIACAEVISAFFLLRIFSTAHRASMTTLSNRTPFFRMLARSTEIRLSLLAPVGITRSITYSFQAASQSATNTASQFDRFAYTLECMFPVVLIIDLLASKIKLGVNGVASSGRAAPSNNEVPPYSPGGAHSQSHNHSLWSRVVSTATAGGVTNGKGKGLEADEISLAPVSQNINGEPLGNGEIVMRTQIKQVTARLENHSERSEELSSELSMV